MDVKKSGHNLGYLDDNLDYATAHCYLCSPLTKSKDGKNNYDKVTPGCAKNDYLARVLSGANQSDINDLKVSISNAPSVIQEQVKAAMLIPPCPEDFEVFKLNKNPFSLNPVECHKRHHVVNPNYNQCFKNYQSMIAPNRFPCQQYYNLPIATYGEQESGRIKKYFYKSLNSGYDNCMKTQISLLSEPQSNEDGVYYCVGDSNYPYIDSFSLGGNTRPDGYDISVDGANQNTKFNVYPIKTSSIDTNKTCQSKLKNLPWGCNSNTKECNQRKGGSYSSKNECLNDPQNTCTIIKPTPGKRSFGFIWLIIIFSLLLLSILSYIGYKIYKYYKTKNI